MSLRDDILKKYGVSSSSSAPTPASGNNARNQILSKYGINADGTRATSKVVDNMALQPTVPTPTNTSKASAREDILAKYLDKKVDEKTQTVSYSSKIKTKPVEATVPVEPVKKPGVVARTVDKGLSKFNDLIDRPEENELGTNKTINTLKFLPSEIMERLPIFGRALKALRDDPETAAIVAGKSDFEAVKTLSKEVPGATVQVGKEYIKSPIRGAIEVPNLVTAGQYQPEINFNIPGLGEINNSDFRIARRVEQGESPVKAVLEEKATGFLDALFFVSIVSKGFTPRQSTVYKGDVKGTFTPAGSQPATYGHRSFRLTSAQAPTNAVQVSPDFVTKIKADGTVISPKYNPNLPTYFRVTQKPGGVIRGEIVQLKPSYFNTLKSKIFGTTPSADGSITVFHGTTKENASSIRQNGFDLTKNRIGEQGANNTNFATSYDDALNYANQGGKSGEVLSGTIPVKDIKVFKSTEAYIAAIEKQFGVYNGKNATLFNNQFPAVRVEKALPTGDYVMVGNPKNIKLLPASGAPAKIPTGTPIQGVPVPRIAPKDGEGTVVFTKDVNLSDIENGIGKPIITNPDGSLTAPHVTKISTSPITPDIVQEVVNFTPNESLAFGKRIIDRINEDVGINISEQQSVDVPEGIKVTETASGDGRPAQFNNQSKIEVFLPDLMKDIKTLASGGEIVAHPETPQFSKVYKLEKGESIEELTVRYIRDVLIHEKTHDLTMTIQDMTISRQLFQTVQEARATNNDAALIKAQTALDKHMRGLEEKALTYERQNKAQIIKDLFGVKGPSTTTQRKIDRVVGGGPDKKVTVSEKKALKEKIKSQEKAAQAGKKVGIEEGNKKVDETKARFKDVIEKIKDRQSTVQAKRHALTEYATTYLPIRVRGKFLKAVKNTISDKEFLDVLGKMQKAAELDARKTLVAEITKELKATRIKSENGLPKVKFELEAQRKLNTIRANIKGEYSVAQAKIADIISEHQTLNPDDVLPLEKIAEIQLLNMVGIKDMTSKELRNVLADIRSIKENGRTLKELERFNRETEIERTRDSIQEVITGGKELPSKSQSLKQPERKGIFKAAKDFLTYQQYGLEEVLDSLSVLDKKSGPYQSFLSKRVGEQVNKAFNEQNTGEMKQIDIANQKLKDIYKVEKNKEIIALLGDLQQPVNLGKVTHADGVDRELIISRGQAIQMHMWQQDPTLADTFEVTLNWGEQVIDKVNSIMKPEDFKMADALLEFYQNYYESINKVFVREYGIDLPFNENYSPVHRNVDTVMPENVLLAQEMQKYATARNNSLKNRVQNNVELKPVDAFENLIRHITKMEHYKAWSEPMFEFRKIFGNKEVRQAILDFHGETAMKITDNFLNDFARDGVARERIITAVDTIRSNATKALLGLNWRVGAKQLVGVLNYGIEMPLTDFTTGIAGFWSDPINKARFLYKNSATLRERFGDGFERDIKFAVSKGYDKTLAKSKNFSEIMFVIIRNADKFTVYQGSWAAYRSKYMEMKKAGKTDAEAKAAGIQYAEQLTNRIQESSRLDTLSPIQRGGSLAKLFTMFQSQPSKYLRVMTNAGRNYRAGRGSKATNAKRALWAWFVVPLIYNIIAEQFVADEYKSSGGKLLLKTTLGPLSYPLVVGQMVQSIYGWTEGERFKYTPSAALAFMDDIQKAVEQLNTGDTVEATTYLIDTIGKLRGVPTGIFTRPFRKSLKEESSSSQGAAAEF